MPYSMSRGIEFALERWQAATPADFLHVTLTIVVLGWFISRYFSR